MHIIVCSMQGYSPEYVALVAYFCVFSLIWDVFCTSGMNYYDIITYIIHSCYCYCYWGKALLR
jgi:hypothetical protein